MKEWIAAEIEKYNIRDHIVLSTWGFITLHSIARMLDDIDVSSPEKATESLKIVKDAINNTITATILFILLKFLNSINMQLCAYQLY